MKEQKTYHLLNDEGKVEEVPLNKYVAGVLRAIDASQDRGQYEPVLNKEVIEEHFQEIKAQHNTIKAVEELPIIKEIETDVIRWFKVDNPVELLIRDLTEAECSPVTIRSYRAAANKYMRFVGYEPEFTHEELFAFRNSLGDISSESRKWYMTVMKCWWEAMGMVWPIRQRRTHKLHRDIKPEEPPFDEDTIRKVIRLAKLFGTPEIKYYFALVTIFAPRRIELASITQRNFIWKNSTGTLWFSPHKHGLTRTHYIPKELVPYFKYEAEEKSEWVMSYKFHEWMRHIHFDIPKAKLGKKNAWHAIRHGVTSAIVNSGVDSVKLRRWMGWRTGSPGTEMVYTYYDKSKDLDDMVYANHPFIKAWTKEE